MYSDEASNKLIQIRMSAKQKSGSGKPSSHPLRFVRIVSAAIGNLLLEPITLEISLVAGIPRIEMLGFKDTAAHDARLRISAALKNSGFKVPGQRITVAISGGRRIDYQVLLDLPIALGILLASAQISLCGEIAAAGAVSLNGDVRGFAAGPAACAVISKISPCVILPAELIKVGTWVSGSGYLIENLKDLSGKGNLKAIPGLAEIAAPAVLPEVNLARLNGQYHALRALQIAACGRHSLCILGAAGSGKSELLGLLPWLLPELEAEAWCELLITHSLAGEEAEFIALNKRPPLRVIHPGMNKTQILGIAEKKFGEWQLSRYGVLFLEEVTNMPASQISLIQELMDKDSEDDGDRVGEHSYSPGHLLLAAGNPCPCGRYFERDGSCTCALGEVQRRLGKIQAAFRERFDLWLSLRSPDGADQRMSLSRGNDLDLAAMKKQVAAAVERSQARNKPDVHADAHLDNVKKTRGRNLAGENQVRKEALLLAESMGEKKKMSLRQYRKLFTIARSIADLDADEEVKKQHFIEAGQYIISNFQEL